MRDDDDDYETRSRRENLMQQRLRRARGEEIDDNLDAYGYADDDGDALPRGFGGGGYTPRRRSSAGGGCAQAVLYLVLGAIVTLLIVVFFVNRTFGSIGSMFEDAVPDISTIIVTPTPQIVSGAAVVRRIQELSRLETAAYTIERVIDVSQGSSIPIVGDLLAGDELLLIAHGTVIAGVDLSSLDENDVTVSPDGSLITVRLPAVQIFQASLDSQKTRVYSRDRGLFAPDNKDLESLARQEAELQILSAACEDGIMQRASDEAVAAMRQFLGLLDTAQVVVEIAPAGACAAPGTAPAGP